MRFTFIVATACTAAPYKMALSSSVGSSPVPTTRRRISNTTSPLAASVGHNSRAATTVKPDLVAARLLAPPPSVAIDGGEFENADFWEDHGSLLRSAWDEYGVGMRSSLARDDDSDRNALVGVVEPLLLEATAKARAFPGIANERDVLSLWEPAFRSSPDLGVYRTRLLTESGLRSLRSELDEVEKSGIPTRRPNGMNRHGIIIDSDVSGAVPLASLVKFVESLLDEIVRPLGRSFFQESIGRDDDMEHFAFTIRYKVGEDLKLAEHRDASVLTLNVNLNFPDEDYGGSSIYFVDDDGTKRELWFEPGMAVLHKGSVRHAALPIEGAGERINLVIWLFGKNGDVRVAKYEEGERLTVEERWSVDNNYCSEEKALWRSML